MRPERHPGQDEIIAQVKRMADDGINAGGGQRIGHLFARVAPGRAQRRPPHRDDAQRQARKGNGQAKHLPDLIERVAPAKIGKGGQARHKDRDHHQRKITPVAKKPGPAVFHLTAKRHHTANCAQTTAGRPGRRGICFDWRNATRQSRMVGTARRTAIRLRTQKTDFRVFRW